MATGRGPARIEVLFLGCGDAFGSGGRRATSILVRPGGAKSGSRAGVLLDAGPGANVALRERGMTSDDVGAVVLSHFHGDHFGGVPFLELDANRVRRDAPLRILGPPGARTRIEALRNCLYSGMGIDFPEEFREPEPDEPCLLPEGTGGGRATPFPADHVPGAPAYSWRIEILGRRIVWSGDSTLTERMIGESAGADLLIHECTGLRPLPGHACHADFEAARDRLSARRAMLIHCGEEVLALANPVFERAHDGLRVVL